MPCHAMPCHTISYHIISNHITAQHSTAQHNTACHVMSCHVMSCHVISYHIISYHIILYSWYHSYLIPWQFTYKLKWLCLHALNYSYNVWITYGSDIKTNDQFFIETRITRNKTCWRHAGHKCTPQMPQSARLTNVILLQPLQWRHNGCDDVSNHQPRDYLPNRLFRQRSKKTSKLRVTGPCEGISQVTGEFPAQKASNAENVYIWWRHHD